MVGAFGHGGRNDAVHFNRHLQFLRGTARLLEEVVGIAFLLAFRAQQRLIDEWREARHLALGQQGLRPDFVVVRAQGLEQRMVGEGGLHDDFTGLVGAPGAATYLRELRKKFFRGAEVGAVKGAVWTYHADQCEVGKVMTLCQHLRADQDIGLAVVDLFAHRAPRAFVACAIAVHAQDACFRKTCLQRFFQTLRADADRLEIGIATGGTGVRHALLRAAVVAAQAAVFLVQHQLARAVLALGQPATGGAHEHRRIAAAIDEDEALFLALQAIVDGGEQGFAQSVLQRQLGDVHAAHDGQGRRLHGALRQLQQLVAAALRVVPLSARAWRSRARWARRAGWRGRSPRRVPSSVGRPAA